MTNCLNCGAPFDVNDEKCSYCGTSYYDMSALDISGGKPFMLKIKTMFGNKECYITQLVRAQPDMTVEFTSDTVDYVDACGCVVRSMVSNRTCLTNIAFEAVQRANGELVTVIVKENHLLSTGYNGTPRGVRNCFDGGCPR